MAEGQRREFHEALLDADAFEDLPGRWQAAIVAAEQNRPQTVLAAGRHRLAVGRRRPSRRRGAKARRRGADCASLLFEAGKSVKQVQEWLGHADPSFTMRTYIHLMDDGLGDAEFFDTAVRSRPAARAGDGDLLPCALGGGEFAGLSRHRQHRVRVPAVPDVTGDVARVNAGSTWGPQPATTRRTRNAQISLCEANTASSRRRPQPLALGGLSAASTRSRRGHATRPVRST